MTTVSTWILKGCPRCEGDILVAAGDSRCLQCGYDSNAVTFSALDRVEFQPEIDELHQSRKAPPRVKQIRLSRAQKVWRDSKLRQRHEEGISDRVLAKEFRISLSYVGLILAGKR